MDQKLKIRSEMSETYQSELNYWNKLELNRRMFSPLEILNHFKTYINQQKMFDVSVKKIYVKLPDRSRVHSDCLGAGSALRWSSLVHQSYICYTLHTGTHPERDVDMSQLGIFSAHTRPPLSTRRNKKHRRFNDLSGLSAIKDVIPLTEHVQSWQPSSPPEMTCPSA